MVSVDFSPESAAVLPQTERLERGRVAAAVYPRGSLERALPVCLGPEACGRCVSACAFGAITQPTLLPAVAHDECIGCGACVKACPLQNFRLLDASRGEDGLEITLKCRTSALPAAGEALALFDENGTPIGSGIVLQAYPVSDGRAVIRLRTERRAALFRAVIFG